MHHLRTEWGRRRLSKQLHSHPVFSWWWCEWKNPFAYDNLERKLLLNLWVNKASRDENGRWKSRANDNKSSSKKCNKNLSFHLLRDWRVNIYLYAEEDTSEWYFCALLGPRQVKKRRKTLKSRFVFSIPDENSTKSQFMCDVRSRKTVQQIFLSRVCFFCCWKKAENYEKLFWEAAADTACMQSIRDDDGWKNGNLWEFSS